MQLASKSPRENICSKFGFFIQINLSVSVRLLQILAKKKQSTKHIIQRDKSLKMHQVFKNSI